MYSSTSAVEAKSHPVNARHWVLPNSASNHSLSSWPRFMTRLNALSSSAKASPRTAIVAIIRATRAWLFSISPSARPKCHHACGQCTARHAGEEGPAHEGRDGIAQFLIGRRRRRRLAQHGVGTMEPALLPVLVQPLVCHPGLRPNGPCDRSADAPGTHRRRLTHHADAAQRHPARAPDLPTLGRALRVVEPSEQIVTRLHDDRQPVLGLHAAEFEAEQHQRRGQPTALTARVADATGQPRREHDRPRAVEPEASSSVFITVGAQ